MTTTIQNIGERTDALKNTGWNDHYLLGQLDGVSSINDLYDEISRKIQLELPLNRTHVEATLAFSAGYFADLILTYYPIDPFTALQILLIDQNTHDASITNLFNVIKDIDSEKIDFIERETNGFLDSLKTRQSSLTDRDELIRGQFPLHFRLLQQFAKHLQQKYGAKTRIETAKNRDLIEKELLKQLGLHEPPEFVRDYTFPDQKIWEQYNKETLEGNFGEKQGNKTYQEIMSLLSGNNSERLVWHFMSSPQKKIPSLVMDMILTSSINKFNLALLGNIRALFPDHLALLFARALTEEDLKTAGLIYRAQLRLGNPHEINIKALNEALKFHNSREALTNHNDFLGMLRLMKAQSKNKQRR